MALSTSQMLYLGRDYHVRPKDEQNEVPKMAKTSRTQVVVVDNTTKESYTVEADQLPRKTEPGVVLYLKINQKGMSDLHQKGIMLRSTPDLEAAWCAATGMSEEGLGSLGSWRKASEKAGFSVTVGGVEFLGSSVADENENVATAGTVAVEAVADQSSAIAIPAIVTPTFALKMAQATPQIVVPQVAAQPQISDKDAHNIGVIKNALSTGMKREQIIAALGTVVGVEKAQALFAIAQPLNFSL